MGTRWSRAGQVAARQYGVISFSQLLDCGFSRSGIQRAVAAGLLIPIHRGVFALGYPPSDRRGVLLAATIAVGAPSCVSFSTAGEYLRLLPGTASPIDVTVPRGAGRSRRSVRIHRAAIDRDERRIVKGVPCTTPSRTIIDIAASSPHRLEGVIKDAGGHGMLEVRTILDLLDRHPRRPGCRLLRMLLGANRALPVFTRSELERRTYELCVAESIEPPMMNVPIDADGGPYEVDCVWIRQRLILECDSKWHDNPITAARDAVRDQALTLAGWRVVRMRWLQIVDAPERCARTIRHLLREQEQLLRR